MNASTYTQKEIARMVREDKAALRKDGHTPHKGWKLVVLNNAVRLQIEYTTRQGINTYTYSTRL